MADSNGCPMTSPDFKRVTGKLRMVKRKKRSRILSDISQPVANLEPKACDSTKGRSVNPFRSQSCSTLAVSTPSPITTCSGESDSFIPKTPEPMERRVPAMDEKFVIPRTPDKAVERYKRRRLTSDGYTLLSKLGGDSPPPPPEDKNLANHLAVDYSLWSKVRFTSKFNLSLLFDDSPEIRSDSLSDFIANSCVQSKCSPQRLFHKHLYYYTYPNLPWLSLYPRKAVDKFKTNSLPPTAFASLKVQWKSAFASAYNGMMSDNNTCGYFYMLCDGFTVMFNCCKSCHAQSAVLSPTTRGLRQNLQARGIEFSLPIYEATMEGGGGVPPSSQSHISSGSRGSTGSHGSVGSRGSTGSRTDVDSTLLDLDDDAENGLVEGVHDSSIDEDQEGERQGGDSEDPLEWLEGMGLEKSHFPSLRTAKVQMEEEAFRKIDYHPSSTVTVVGKEMLDKLRAFLTDYSKSIATTGPLAHIPPTIVSRSAFLNATVEQLELKTGQAMNENGQRHSHLDLVGPVLPGLINDIFDDVIRDTLPSEEAVNVSVMKINNSHVYNTVSRSCDSSCDLAVQREDHAVSSFTYSNGKYHHTDVKMEKRETSH